MTRAPVLWADLLAMACALALLFVIGLDWYSTAAGDEARRIERSSDPQGALGGEVPRAVEERARESAEDAERNALQVDGLIDRALLAALILTVLLACAATFLRAAGRRFAPPLTPSALAAMAATVAALLVAYRLVQQPGLDAGTTVKAGGPVALVVLGLLALSCAAAVRREDDGTAWPEAAPAAAHGPSIESAQ